MDDKFNTASGWVLFAGIIALGASIGSGMYFHADSPEMPEEPGYFIDAPEEGAGEDAGPDLGTLLASADAAAGEAVFAKCTACHTIEQGAANGIGPNLYGVMGAAIGAHAPGFAYSSALSEHGGEWSWENMDDWLASPRAFASGTKMSFAGLSDPEDRANVMEYLSTFGGAPAKPEPVVAVEGVEGLDGAGEGPGVTEGAAPDVPEAAGAMGDEQPVPTNQPATTNDGPLKPGG
ncbi:c-type cytochrome [Qipengyuania sp. DY56-A-20]|jgi:cytochrome c|uniref:C-type cytochrome n=1 Tax=Qipengyuania benthica TaxID=3067651 RepID=A0ABT9HA06_9SPHN|nr:c-type cytochrome [Qipengyuania sp. DY56-A-20]MBU1253563.1 c-type cytochrome [Alphaproteobacteria bacterium]MBU1606506.1 c-type cytochrome [Alphaproteobacteria bacterium]MDP4540153.1 c-type cytochrome [Qipengyuania sp. DY56-A-20]